MGKYNAKEKEKEWQEYWEKNDVYRFDPQSKKPIYSIDTPPPTVSGKMHMGHAFMYSQMDFVSRFKRMTGHNVFYPFGTDDNGLPTQMLIEKIKGVRASKLGRKDFTKLCIKTLKEELRPKYIEDWKRIAIGCDWNAFYTTIDEHSQKISQQSFIDLYKKKLAYRKKAPIMVCPKCQTAIAQVELEDAKLKSTLNYIKAKLETGEYLIFATTRPEVIFGNVGFSLHEDGEYVSAKKGDETWIISKDSLEKFQDEWELKEIGKPFTGKKLVGKKVTIPLVNREQQITHDEITRTDYGTGFVYYCTYGGVDCIEWLERHPGVEPIDIMDTSGRLNEKAGKFEGLKSRQAREQVLEELEKLGMLVKKEAIEHVVNTHERCGTEIEYVRETQWFIQMHEHKKTWLDLGKKLNWYPHHMKNRYDNWAKGLRWDWCISRQIYFGVPFPVWYSKKTGEPIFADEDQLPVDPINDQPSTLPKDHTQDDIIPETDIINTWATSSMTPQLAINLFKDESIKKKLYPMNLRPQGHDIISFWLFNTVVKAHYHYNSLPWNDVMITGWALDPKGKKMSKSKGNVVEPQRMVEKYSADALRFWAASSSLGEDLPFKEKELVAGQKFVTKMWNASRFCYMHLEDYKDEQQELEVFDKWILSKLQKLIKKSTQSFEKYEYSKTKQEVEKFFWHTFCDNYLEVVKDRLYNPQDRGEKKRKAAQYTLYHTLLAVVKLMAPITPHITEEVYHQYFAAREDEKSVHGTTWPKPTEKLIDDENEKSGDMAIDIISAVRKYKSSHSLSLKEELSELHLHSEEIENFKESILSLEKDLMAVTGAKKIVFSKEVDMPCDNFAIEVGIKK